MNPDFDILGSAAHEDLRRFRLLVEEAPFCVHEIGLDGTFRTINPEGCRLLGFDSPDQLRGVPFAEVIAERSLAVATDAFQRALKGESLEFECELKNPAGNILTSSHIFPLRDEAGGIVSLFGLSIDISKGHEALEELRRSEERYRQMFETNLAVKFILDPRTGAIVQVNQAACDFYGYSREELQGMSVFDINIMTPEEIRAEMVEAEKEERLIFEFRHRLKNGEVRDVEVLSGPVDTPEGVRLYSIIHDITDRKRVERELEESRERFALAVRGSNDGIWDWDILSGRTWWSPRFKELLGHKEEEIAASREMLYQLMHEENVGDTRQAAEDHLVHGKRYDVRYRLRTKSGEYRWFRARGQAVRDDQGKPIRASGSMTDIHEEVLASQQREDRAARLARQQQCILALASDPSLAASGLREACMHITELACEVLDVGRCSVLLLEPNGKGMRSIDLFVPANKEHLQGSMLRDEDYPRFFAELERSRAVVSRNPMLDPRFAEFSKEYLRERKVRSLIQVPVRRAGNLVGLIGISETRVERQWHEDEVHFALDLAYQVARLIDQVDARSAGDKQRELERQMLQAQKMESLGLMAGGVAHDFNNLLVAILGNADLLRDMVPDGSRQEALVHEIGAASQRAAELCQQMLSFSGHGTLSRERFDLQDLVREMSHLLRVTVSKDAELEFLPGDKLPLMEGDATQVRQVIMNLILNASESLPQGRGRIILRTGLCHLTPSPVAHGLAVPQAGDYLFLEVEDKGSGMEEETLERLFDPFFTTKFTGRGLGMASVLGIVRAHGGGIRVESLPDKGSCFEVWFPLANEPVPDLMEASVADGDWRGSGTVLLVDDDQTVLQLGKEMLQRLGFEVVVSTDGQKAVEVFQERHQDLRLVLLDLTMPGWSGEDVYAALQDFDASVPVIMSSGYTEQDVTQKLGPPGLRGFLQKPYTLEQLRAKIQGLLG